MNLLNNASFKPPTMINKCSYLLLLFCTPLFVFAQPNVIDKTVAIVGGSIIKQSDIEQQYLQYMQQGSISAGNIRCTVFEEMMYQKLLLNQAQLDSIAVTDEQAEGELDRRMRFYIEKFGSEKALEDYYGKSILVLKDEFKQSIKEQMLIQQMESKITEGIKVTPSEVKDFFLSLPADSIPLLESEVQVSQIVKKPVITEESRQIAREKINALRERIIKGEDFATLAKMYSEDPGSFKQGGELGQMARGQLYPEFEAAAFKLKGKEISPVVLSKAGYHIIQLIDRKGEYVNVRHILIQPQISNDALLQAKSKLDSVYNLITTDKMSFKDAAMQFSDEDSKNNGGQVLSLTTGQANIKISELDPSIFFIIDKMQVGDYSMPVPMKTEDAQSAYRILHLKSRTEPHRANLNADYDVIQEAALNQKKIKAITEWTKTKIKKTYISIQPEYKNCTFKNNWLN